MYLHKWIDRLEKEKGRITSTGITLNINVSALHTELRIYSLLCSVFYSVNFPVINCTWDLFLCYDSSSENEVITRAM